VRSTAPLINAELSGYEGDGPFGVPPSGRKLGRKQHSHPEEALDRAFPRFYRTTAPQHGHLSFKSQLSGRLQRSSFTRGILEWSPAQLFY
jgi:hypothetical protein